MQLEGGANFLMQKIFKIIVENEYANGIRIITTGLSTIKITIFPRYSLPQYLTSEMSKKQGLYMLYNEVSNGDQSLYIGETEVMGERLKQHDKTMGKHFWTHTIVCQETGCNLNKAHYKNLEYKIHHLATQSGRATIINKSIPTQSKLSEEDEVLASEFLEIIRQTLVLFNYKFLEMPVLGAFEEDMDVFYLAMGAVSGKMRVENPNRMLLLPGSTCMMKSKTEVGENFYPMIIEKQQMIKNNILQIIDDTNIAVVQKDIVFDSENEAAAFVLMRDDIEGAEVWRDMQGYSFYEKITLENKRRKQNH